MGATQISGSSAATPIPVPTTPNLGPQPSDCSSLTHSMPQSCTKSKTTTIRKRWTLGLHLCRAMDAYTGGTLDLCELIGLNCFSTPLFWGKTCTQGEWSLIEPNLRASTPTPGEQTLPLIRQHQPWNREEVLPHALHRIGSYNTNHISYQGDSDQYTLRKDVAGIHTKINPCTKDTEHT